MKKELLVLVFMMLPLAMNAAELINGIYYNLNTEAQTAEVKKDIISSQRTVHF